MKSHKRIKFWKKVVQHYRNKQQAEISYYNVWKFSHYSSRKKIERFISVEKWAIKRLLSAMETHQNNIEFKKGFYNTLLKEPRPNIIIKEFELENTDL